MKQIVTASEQVSKLIYKEKISGFKLANIKSKTIHGSTHNHNIQVVATSQRE